MKVSQKIYTPLVFLKSGIIIKANMELYMQFSLILGRYNLYSWQLIGPIITKKYIDTWLKNTECRILNLGGGGHCIDECLTVDISPRVDAYVDITKPLPFYDSEFDAIFCEQAIEHISLESAKQLLKECWRILKPNGIIRITTPDLNWFTKRAVESIEFCDELNKIFYEHGHQYLYTRQALQYYGEQAGFINLRMSSYRDCESKLGYLDSHADRFNYLPEFSQYLEMQKQTQYMKLEKNYIKFEYGGYK
jgi:predicted SAM-dependent methyltransferase